MTTERLRIDGTKVQRARWDMPKENGRPISQATIAQRAGIHWVTLSNIERGKARNTTLETLGRLAEALKVDPIALIADDEPKPEVFDDHSPFRDAA